MNKKGENNPNWKGGLSNCIDCGKQLSHRRYTRCKSCANKGKLNKMFGNQLTEEVKDKIRKKLKGNKCHLYKDGRCSKTYYCKCGNKISYPTWLLGKKRCNTCKNIGKNNPRYIDGRTKNPYPPEFNAKLKESIRERDNHICQRCGMTKEEHYKKYNCNLDVHHIDHNKNNCKKSNLETLCKRCNIRDNK